MHGQNHIKVVLNNLTEMLIVTVANQFVYYNVYIKKTKCVKDFIVQAKGIPRR